MGEAWALNGESSLLKLGSDWLVHQAGTGNQAQSSRQQPAGLSYTLLS